MTRRLDGQLHKSPFYLSPVRLSATLNDCAFQTTENWLDGNIEIDCWKIWAICLLSAEQLCKSIRSKHIEHQRVSSSAPSTATTTTAHQSVTISRPDQVGGSCCQNSLISPNQCQSVLLNRSEASMFTTRSSSSPPAEHVEQEK